MLAGANAGLLPAAQVYHAAPPTVVKTVSPIQHHYAAQHVLTKTDEEFDPHPQYQFGYNVHDNHSGDSKSQVEERDGDVVRGEYSLIDADGYKRTVKYTADDHNGFNAVVEREPLIHTVGAAPTVVKTVAPAAQYAEPALVKTVSPVAHYTAPAVVKTVTPVAHYSSPAVVKTVAPVAHYTSPSVVKAVEAVAHYSAPAVAHYGAPTVVKTHYASPAVVKTVEPVAHYAGPAYPAFSAPTHYIAHH